MFERHAKATVVGIGFMPALFLVFMTLKLCGVITWHWAVVALPLYGPAILAIGGALAFAAFTLFVLLGFAVAGLIAAAVTELERKTGVSGYVS